MLRTFTLVGAFAVMAASAVQASAPTANTANSLETANPSFVLAVNKPPTHLPPRNPLQPKPKPPTASAEVEGSTLLQFACAKIRKNDCTFNPRKTTGRIGT